MGKQEEKILSRRVLIDKRPYLEVVEIEYQDAYGALHKYISVDRPGAVAIATITEDDKVILIKQFRPSIGKYVLSLPSGLIDKEKSNLEIAKDELLEEAGFIAKRWYKIIDSYNSTGILNEQVHLYLATGLTEVGAKNNVDEGESINVIKISWSGRVISDVLKAAIAHDCVIETSLITHLVMVQEEFRYPFGK